MNFLIIAKPAIQLVYGNYLPAYRISFKIVIIEIHFLCTLLSGDCYNRGEKIDSSKLGADPGLPTESSSVIEATPKEGINRTAYRCKKCRRLVALQDNVVDHTPGEGETSFEWHKRRSGNPFNKSSQSECSSVFVEPLRWMTAGKKMLLILCQCILD